jgi:hypothetical protein
MVGIRALLPAMHAGGHLLVTSQQGAQGEQVHSAVLLQH